MAQLIHATYFENFWDTPKFNDCLQKKKFVLEDIERKINNGLDRSLNAIVMWVKLYLQSEQKKNDFKPETDDFDTVASAVSRFVIFLPYQTLIKRF